MKRRFRGEVPPRHQVPALDWKRITRGIEIWFDQTTKPRTSSLAPFGLREARVISNGHGEVQGALRQGEKVD